MPFSLPLKSIVAFALAICTAVGPLAVSASTCEGAFSSTSTSTSVSTSVSATASTATKLTADLADAAREFATIPDNDRNGFVTNNVPVTYQTLRMGYALGHYPYGLVEGRDVWINSPDRGVIFYDQVNVRKNDRAAIRKVEAAILRGELRFEINTAFEQVVRGCAEQIRQQRNAETNKLDGTVGTWMTEDYRQAITAAFKAGEAHSFEMWRGDKLIGGVIFLTMNGMLHGETMFHLESDVVKYPFDRAIKISKEMGYTYMDVQVAPKDSKSFSVRVGAYEVSRPKYTQLLVDAQRRGLVWNHEAALAIHRKLLQESANATAN